LGTHIVSCNLGRKTMARKAKKEQEWRDDDWEDDASPDEQVEQLLDVVSPNRDAVKRESSWRRIERYREDKQLQDRLREVYD